MSKLLRQIEVSDTLLKLIIVNISKNFRQIDLIEKMSDKLHIKKHMQLHY